jgi:hypothetical protein
VTPELDQFTIDHALKVAADSPCRSKRGVVLYDMETGAFRGAGTNGPPGGCPGRAICAGTCGQRSVHAEMRALREAAMYIRYGHPPGPYDLIHVELAADSGAASCDGPNCWQCSREIVDVGFVGGVWLYEATPEEHCPHIDERRVDCPYCQGEACRICDSALVRGRCDHDVLDRHCGLHVTDARWRRYTAEEFHRVTLERCGMVPR